MAGPIYTVQPGMGELILIQVFVVIVIGGIGSIRGALVGAIIVGMVDTLGRAFLKPMLGAFISPTAAEAAGPALASMLIYLLMAGVLALPAAGPLSRAGMMKTRLILWGIAVAGAAARCRRSSSPSASRSTSTSCGAS